MPCPKIGWSSSSASRIPPMTVMTSTADDEDQRVAEGLEEGRIGEEVV